MRIRILDEAEQDLIDGFHFYEAQGEGLGDYFLNALFSDIDSLCIYAGIHPRYFGYHRFLSHRFPFAIYYRVINRIVNVHAVLDCRRNPDRIEDRLK